MKFIHCLLCLVAINSSCDRNDVCVKPTTSVVCSPQEIASNEWATLTIFQIYGKNFPLLQMREDKLEKVALFAKRIEIYDSNADGSGYKVQIYAIKPLDGKSVLIDSNLFLNAVGQPRRPIMVSVKQP